MRMLLSPVRLYRAELGVFMQRDVLRGWYAGSEYAAWFAMGLGVDPLGLLDQDTVRKLLKHLQECMKCEPYKAWRIEKGIEVLMQRVFGKDWREEIIAPAQEVQKQTKKVIDALEMPEDLMKYAEDLDLAIPDEIGVPLKNTLRAARAARAVALATELVATDKDVSPAQAARMIQKTLELGNLLTGPMDVPVLGDVIGAYAEAVGAIADAIAKIEDDLFQREADIMIRTKCEDILSNPVYQGFHGIMQDVVNAMNQRRPSQRRRGK